MFAVMPGFNVGIRNWNSKLHCPLSSSEYTEAMLLQAVRLQFMLYVI